MPKKSRSKKKAKKVMKKKAKKMMKKRPVRRAKKAARRPAKKAKRAKKSRAQAKPARKTVKKMAKKTATRKQVQAAAEHVLGKVTHYYDRIGVAVVALEEPIRLGDTVVLKRGDHVFEQRIESLQVDHTPIETADRGQEVGMKVNEVADVGTVILAA